MQALKPRPSFKSLEATKMNCRALADYELVVAAQTLDQTAFTVLYERHVRHVRASIFRLSPDWQSSHDDMVQDVFVRVWRSLYTLKNPWAFKSWLNRLIRNMFYDELRKRPGMPTLSLDRPFNLDDEEDFASQDIVDVKDQPDDRYARKQLLEQITVSMTLLPRQFAKVVALRDLDGLSYEEIAVRTKTSLGTVKSRIARGRTKLQAHLQPLIA
jgi:RNA polymerase sigma factor (sigma-70 family)